MRKILSLLVFSTFIFGCSDKPIATNVTPDPFPEVDTQGTFFELAKYLNATKPSDFVLDKSSILDPRDSFSDEMLYPGTKVNLNFSNDSESLERLDPTRNSNCYAKIDYQTEPTDTTNYKLFLSYKLGSYHLTMIATRVLWKVVGTPQGTKEEMIKLLQKRPECTYVVSYAKFGLQATSSIDIEIDPFHHLSSVNTLGVVNPGLVASSEDLSKVWEIAQDIRRIFKANKGDLAGSNRSVTSAGQAPMFDLWSDATKFEQVELEFKNALAQDPGYLSDPTRADLKFPAEVTGVAVEARIQHLLSPIDPRYGGRLKGLGIFVPGPL